MINETKDALCPECMADAHWDYQEQYELHGRRFTERALVCSENCGWFGPCVLFQWIGNEPMKLLQPRFPADPFDGAVPMLPPQVKP
jgi:hypothetical protein